MLGHDPSFGKGGHEIRIALPARHDMQMKVLCDAGSGHLSQVKPQVETMGMVTLLEGPHASLGTFHEFQEFISFQGEKVIHVPVGRHHEVARIIWKSVQDDKAEPEASQNQMGGVILSP